MLFDFEQENNNQEREVRPERTHWRDQELSERHRRWGWGCPALDIDFLLLEYDKGEPSALVEYKHEKAPDQYMSQPSYQALIKLASRASLPLFAVRYSGDFENWTVIPLNNLAQDHVPPGKTMMDERGYVSLLYTIRGQEIPVSVLNGLNKKI
jgi:hypothetical protein